MVDLKKIDTKFVSKFIQQSLLTPFAITDWLAFAA